jgi:hypothetical protein
MTAAPMRALLGFVAAAISVLTFHQGLIAAMHAAGLVPFAPYPTAPIPPFGVPFIVDLCFWGGLYGAVFGLLMPRFNWPLWLCGILLGVIAALVSMFVVAPIKGHPIAYDWHLRSMLLAVLINGFWGLGVGLILPLLMPRAMVRANP